MILIRSYNLHRAADLKEALDFFHDIGIRNFIVLQEIDPTFHSEWPLTIKSMISKITYILLSPEVLLLRQLQIFTYHPKSQSIIFLRRLLLKTQTTCLFRLRHLSPMNGLQPDLNYLLYKQKLKPVFTCFERTVISCNSDVVNGLYKIQPASFCLDLDFIISPKHDDFITRCMRDNKIILPAISRDIWGLLPNDKQVSILS